MLRTVPVGLAARIGEAEAGLAAGWSLPYDWNVDPDVLDFELGAIFERSWQAVGLERDVADPGARLVESVGRVPVVVVRDDDGQLQAFVNVCRHRAYPVVVGSGAGRTMQCRYHAWTYDLRGRLLKAAGATSQFDTAELGLLPLPVNTWRGVIFVNGRMDCESFDSVYPHLDRVAAENDLDLRTYRFHSRLVADADCNWKVFYDNIVECYHCATMHRTTFTTRYDDRSFMRCEWDGAMRFGRTTVRGVDDPGEPSHRSIQLFPGTVLLQDAVIGQVCRFAPMSPNATRMTVDYLYNPDVPCEEVEEFIDLWNATFAEDREIVARQQRGMGAGLVKRGRLLTEREESVPGVQKLILDAYRQAVAQAASVAEPTKEGNDE